MLPFFLLTTVLESKPVIRAAFDVGSNDTKLRVAVVDDETNEILDVLYNENREVKLRFDLTKSQDGKLSTHIENELVNTINSMLQNAARYQFTQTFGIGTSVFRTALNGQEVLNSVKEKTGMMLHLSSQEEEGLLGFHTAVGATKKGENRIISWDSGSGSFQLTGMNEGKIAMYGAELAFVPVYQLLFQMRGIAEISKAVNPVQLEEVLILSQKMRDLLPPCPDWLKNTSKEVIGIGGIKSCFSVGKIATGKWSYTKEDIYQALLQFTNKSDQELSMFPAVHEVAVELTIVYTLMNFCGIETVTYVPTNGTCDGILKMPHFWN